MKFLTVYYTLFLITCNVSGSIAGKGKKRKKSSDSWDESFDPRLWEANTRPPTWAPTYSPTYYPTYTPTTSPTVITLNAETAKPTLYVHGTSSYYEFSTGNGQPLPTLNAQTEPPTYHPTSSTYTYSPTYSPTYYPTFAPPTSAPSGSSDEPTESPTEIDIANAATRGPSPTMSGNSSSSEPTGNSTDGAQSSPSPCISNFGDFFLARERQGNDTQPLHQDYMIFAYELETAGRTTLNQTLPTLEAAFVDAILHVLFPSQCYASTERRERFLEAGSVIGVRAAPEDMVIDGRECVEKNQEKNNCAVLHGIMTIFSADGDVEQIMEDAHDALSEAMDRGDFVDSSLGIVRVSSTDMEVQDESLQEDIDNSVLDDKDPNLVGPVSDNGSVLGIGLTLCGAGVIILVLGASVYRRRKGLSNNDLSTLQEGVTIGGLSRFDTTPEGDHDHMDMIRDVEILPLSPPARPLSDHRYTSDGGSILTFQR